MGLELTENGRACSGADVLTSQPFKDAVIYTLSGKKEYRTVEREREGESERGREREREKERERLERERK